MKKRYRLQKRMEYIILLSSQVGEAVVFDKGSRLKGSTVQKARISKIIASNYKL